MLTLDPMAASFDMTNNQVSITVRVEGIVNRDYGFAEVNGVTATLTVPAVVKLWEDE